MPRCAKRANLLRFLDDHLKNHPSGTGGGFYLDVPRWAFQLLETQGAVRRDGIFEHCLLLPCGRSVRGSGTLRSGAIDHPGRGKIDISRFRPRPQAPRVREGEVRHSSHAGQDALLVEGLSSIGQPGVTPQRVVLSSSDELLITEGGRFTQSVFRYNGRPHTWRRTDR